MGISYKDAGVDIERASLTKSRMTEAVQSTYGPEVLGGHGRFGGMFDIQWLQFKQNPVLVASTDGVGTKTMIAAAVGRFDTLGHDLVNHCVDDILVQGARPLFFLDYVASSHLDTEHILQVVQGIATACRQANCALLGGETAEMPGVYAPGELDLVGTIVGWVEREHIIDGSRIEAGDVLIGLPSSGLHTNGYSLARRVLADIPLDKEVPALGGTLGDALLAPHRNYLKAVSELLAAGIDIRGLAHITGGGFYDNLPRVLPKAVTAHLRFGSWPITPVFLWLKNQGGLSWPEMLQIFNTGIGYVLIAKKDVAEDVMNRLSGMDVQGYVIGEIKTRVEDQEQVQVHFPE